MTQRYAVPWAMVARVYKKGRCPMKHVITVLVTLLVAASLGWAAETMTQAPQRPTPRPEGPETPAPPAPERLREAPGAEEKAPKQKETGSRAQVKAVQEALKEKGQDPGPIDGIMGPRTKAALKDFQRSEDLPETGRLDAETMTKLGATTPSEERMEQPPQGGMEQTPQGRMKQAPQEKKPY